MKFQYFAATLARMRYLASITGLLAVLILVLPH
jgi:hypothetical protein